MAVGGPVSGLGAAGGLAAAAAAAAAVGGAGGEGGGDAAGRRRRLCACSSYSATERQSKLIKREPTCGPMCPMSPPPPRSLGLYYLYWRLHGGHRLVDGGEG